MVEYKKEDCTMTDVQSKAIKAIEGQQADRKRDAAIMLEQLRQMFNINDSVCSWMDYKIAALKRKVEK